MYYGIGNNMVRVVAESLKYNGRVISVGIRKHQLFLKF